MILANSRSQRSEAGRKFTDSGGPAAVDEQEPAPVPATVAGRVTVLVPAWNEAADMGTALDAVCAQDVDLARLEVIVVDGASSDGTSSLAERTLDGRGLARGVVLSNPSGTTPSSLNLGLAHATGEYVCRVDARSLVPRDYVRRCAAALARDPTIRVVGGRQVALPRDGSARALGIARALNNRWAMGLAAYRRGAASGPTDTVYLGAFRTADLRRVGGWDEHFTTNQDFELNRRMAQEGLIWLDAELAVGYLGRHSVAALFTQYRRFGSWKVEYWRRQGEAPLRRQIALLAGPPAAATALALTLLVRPRMAVPLMSAALVAGMGVEIKGADSPEAGAAGHAVSLAAMAAVAAGWTTGVWAGMVRQRWSPTGP